MPRSPRPRSPDTVYHLTARGNRRGPILTDALECKRFLALLVEVVERFGWTCFAYCLMTNHYHLLVQTPEANVSEGMHRLNGGYARWFNRRHGYEGHVFQRRFHSVAVESDWHLLEASRYVVLNPVRAGIVSHPRDWPWSSYLATVGGRSRPEPPGLEELRKHFGRDPERAGAAFAAFVDDARCQGPNGRGRVPGTRAWPLGAGQPTPYVPGKRSARRRTRSAAGRPTTFR